MRLITIAALLILALPHALAAQPIVARIRPTATLENVRTFPAGQVRFYLLWNREISARPIGHAYQSCQRAANDGMLCNSIYNFPFGKIASTGEARSFARFSAVITGGTQSARARRADHPGYVGAQGTVVTRRIGPGTFTITFLLQGRA